MNKLNSKISTQDCFIEVVSDDIIITNDCNEIKHQVSENKGCIYLDIRVSESKIIPRITFKIKREDFINIQLKLTLLNDAKLEILDESEYMHGTKIEFISELGKGSLFELYRLNVFNELTENSYLHQCRLSKDCVFKDFNFTNGSKLMKNETEVSLADENAKYIGSGVVITNSTNCDNSLKINHISPSAISDCSFKTVSRGNANVTFNGKVIVKENCNNSVSSQISKGLVMDENANVNLIPELEISNDDVLCSHGAASGKPDENVLFYLTSRGISRKEAEKIYIQGFLGEFVDKIDNVQMKVKAKQFISQNS